MRTHLCTLLLFVPFLSLALAQAQDYSVIKLPTLGGGHTSASTVNESGLITGNTQAVTYGQFHAFVWSRTQGIQDLGTLDGYGTFGESVNNHGDVTGWGEEGIALLWTAGTGWQKIGPPPVPYTTGYGINDSRQIVGTYGDVASRGFLWTETGGMQDLGTLGCSNCFPSSINQSGQVVGSFELPDQSVHAFLWTQADDITDLGTLGGTSSVATAINDAGQVVGGSAIANGDNHAFFWTAASGMQDLGTLPGEPNSSAEAVDSAGRVVGHCWHPGKDNGLPFTWTQSGGMSQLGPFPKHTGISDANGVNAAGQVLLRSYSHLYGGYISYLLTPLMSVTLTSSLNPSQSGQPVTFTATVGSSLQGPPPDGELVTFRNGGKTLASVPLQAGVATFTMTLTATRTIKAAYVGDAYYAPTKPVALKQVVEK
jgi:probable HAF family extracellular repeat protein